MAGKSDVSLANFLRNTLALVAQVRASGKRAFLLAHSMGNHALAGAVAQIFAPEAGAIPATFNEAILAAADEVNTTLETSGAGMFRLRDLADRISVYSSHRDVAMYLSMAVNQNARLGFDGPAVKGNTAIYKPETFRSVDCTEVYDFSPLIPPDATHQYYRRSKTVRVDIVKLMAAAPVTPGVSSLTALPFGI
jgi:esterase/lipase superfamily enzyme